MAIMVANGANAGGLSPFAPTGVIVNGVMAEIGLGGFETLTYLNNMMAHVGVAFLGYFLLGGWRLLGKFHRGALVLPGTEVSDDSSLEPDTAFHTTHWVTLGVIGTLLVGVILFDVSVGLGAFAAAIVLSLLKAGDELEAVKAMPWRVIMMVCGVTVLISVLDEAGGLELFTQLLAGLSTSQSVTGVVAFSTGLISIYSSTSGVVLPAFLPTAPGLAAQLGGVEPLAIASSMNIGAHLVDVSALSTLGALCMAAAPGTRRQSKALQPAHGLGSLDDRGRRWCLLPALHRAAGRSALAVWTRTCPSSGTRSTMVGKRGRSRSGGLRVRGQETHTDSTRSTRPDSRTTHAVGNSADLVGGVGDVDHRRSQFISDPLDVRQNAVPQGLVNGGQRLVQ